MTRNPEVTSRIMAAIRPSGTRPELLLRHELHRRGLRYRLTSKLVGKPDLVFAAARVACFVDGDRWHGNGWRTRGLQSFDQEFQHANAEFWRKKIECNVKRDREVDQLLTESGWCVVRVWASDIYRDIREAADRVESIVRQRSGSVAG
jgi:DNA mismatch endonuclease (patch repair protein)